MDRARRTARNLLRDQRGFTLIELLITMMIIAMMASLVLFALYRAQETAKEQKTRSLIAKLDAIVKARWESYKTRRVPIVIPPGKTPIEAARMRLDGLRDLMRMELPDRYTDIVDVTYDSAAKTYDVTTSPAPLYAVPAPPAVFNTYLRRIVAAKTGPAYPSPEYQGAEMLYLIVMTALAEDGDAREVFKADNIGDFDSDGMPEFLDGWRRPIEFLRWAPGFVSDLTIMGYGGQPMSHTPPTNPLRVTIDPTLDPGNPIDMAKLSTLSGAYVGCTAALMAPGDSRFTILGPGDLATITGYQYTGGVATFMFSTPEYTKQLPFALSNIAPGIVVLAPDPFDPAGVYPLYSDKSVEPSGNPPNPNTSIPSFALYPLIYSAGPDVCYGIRSETDVVDPLHPLKYTDNKMYPFYVCTRGVEEPPFMIGEQTISIPGIPPTDKDPFGEPNFVPGGYQDNIHNHMQGLK